MIYQKSNIKNQNETTKLHKINTEINRRARRGRREFISDFSGISVVKNF